MGPGQRDAIVSGVWLRSNDANSIVDCMRMVSQAMLAYRRRVLDDELDDLLGGLPAIAIEGARGVGKTATASQRARTTFRLDDPRERQLAEADLDRLTTAEPPILIDEWQRSSWSWDAVRRAVDEDRTPGRFLLTGSATPRHPPTHPGAGRIVPLRMRPLALVERDLTAATVRLSDLLTGRRQGVEGQTDVGLERYAYEIVASGLPGLRDLDDRQVRASLDGYLRQIVDQDLEAVGLALRDPIALRRWLQAYAGAISTTASYETIRDAAAVRGSDRPAKTTVMRWVDALERIWMIDPLPAWSTGGNELGRLLQGPRHHLVDPAFAARLRNASVASLLDATPGGVGSPRDGTLLGALFESLVTLSVRVLAQSLEATVGHFRTRNGDHEVDLIVQDVGGRVLAIEVKLTAVPGDRDMRHLRWLRDRLGDELLDAVVLTTGPHAYRTADGIAVVPAALLGP